MLKNPSPIIKLNDLICNEIYELKDNFLGKILTIIDASISNSEQRKGIKDLIKEVAYHEDNIKWFLYRIRRMIYEFDKKYAKTTMTPAEAYFIETGKWEANEKQQSPVSPEYFGEN
jgi:hypothetical protein